MIYSDFHGKQLSLLGFGTMRLPMKDGAIDEAQVKTMTKYAIDHGVNYFDTAYPYHNGDSERVIGRVLSEYPRDSFYLATKYPGHQLLSGGYNPAAVFEEQLQKCGVEYFDFYLLHNVNEKSIETYLDPRWGIIDYFKKQKELGRIKHLGFSSHAEVPCLERFLEKHGKDMEFCQIQLNYLDWTLQKAKEKCELLAKHNIPVWVMEPVRGGKLATLSAENTEKLKSLCPNDSVVSWAFRFLQGVPNVQMILSGMSNQEQMEQNVATFDVRRPLSISEVTAILEVAETLKDSIPCTGCRYCCEGCPKGLNIPNLLSAYNELRVAPATNVVIRIEFMDEDKKPSACIGCGKCTRICPQNIDVPGCMKDFTERLSRLPSWTEICAQREAAAKKGK